MIIKFYAFLNATNLSDIFVEECKKHVPSRDTRMFILKTLNEKPHEIFLRAFSWKDTKRGQKYWSNINNKWLKQLC